MRKPIGWVDEDCENGAREVRVTFFGNTIKWQFLPKGSKEWDYDSVPTDANWDQLEAKLANLWQRGHAFKNEIELAKKRIYTPSKPYKPQQDYSQQIGRNG